MKKILNFLTKKRGYKKDFVGELNVLFKTTVKVYEDKEYSIRTQLPMLGQVRVDWLEMLYPVEIKGGIIQEVDIEVQFESDRKLRSVIAEMSKKYPERYELIIKPRN